MLIAAAISPTPSSAADWGGLRPRRRVGYPPPRPFPFVLNCPLSIPNATTHVERPVSDQYSARFCEIASFLLGPSSSPFCAGLLLFRLPSERLLCDARPRTWRLSGPCGIFRPPGIIVFRKRVKKICCFCQVCDQNTDGSRLRSVVRFLDELTGYAGFRLEPAASRSLRPNSQTSPIVGHASVSPHSFMLTEMPGSSSFFLRVLRGR